MSDITGGAVISGNAKGSSVHIANGTSEMERWVKFLQIGTVNVNWIVKLDKWKLGVAVFCATIIQFRLFLAVGWNYLMKYALSVIKKFEFIHFQ